MMKPNYLITLTVKNPMVLTRGGVQRVRRSFSQMLRLKHYKERLSGGMYALEVHNKGNGWHPHMHCIASGRDIHTSRVSYDWHRITGDSNICDVRDIVVPDDAFKYILKDLLKPPQCLSKEKEYNEALKGLRFVSKFGDWYRYPIEPSKKGSCPNCGNTDLISEFFIDQQFRQMQLTG